MTPYNVYQMTPDGTMEHGISISKDTGGYFIRLGAGCRRGVLPCDDNCWYMGRKLLAASPKYDPNKCAPRRDWRGALLLVRTFNLEFRQETSSYFGDISNAWPGVETIEPAFFQYGERQEADQQQIVAIEHDTGVFVCDRARRYIYVKCLDGVLSSAPADLVMFGNSLAERARVKLVGNYKALEWTKKNLERIGMSGSWTPELEDMLRAAGKQWKCNR